MQQPPARWAALNAASRRERRFVFHVDGDAPGPSWAFHGTDHSWIAVDATHTVQPDRLAHVPNGSNPRITTQFGVGIDGTQFYRVRARIRRTGGSGWVGRLHWLTATRFSSFAGYYHDIPEPAWLASGAWGIAEWDMREPLAGDDWVGSTVERLRFHFGDDVGDDFEIDWIATSGSMYFVSHGDITVTGPGVVVGNARLKSSAVTSQRLYPQEGRATIGSFSFDVVAVAESATEAQRDSLLIGTGLRSKRVEFYSGFAGLDWDDYLLENTQVVHEVGYKDLVYSIRCQDITREARQDVFEPVVMHLAQPLAIDATTIEVDDASALVAVEHGTSYSDGSSGQTVAYVQIDDEIIRVAEADIGTTQLTNVVRGVLGTRAAEHSTDETASTDRRTAITEVPYLQLPFPQPSYAWL